MADQVVGRAVIEVGGKVDPNIGRDIDKAFDAVDDTLEDAARALRKVQEAVDDARSTTKRAFGELGESSQLAKDGFGDLSSSASALGAGLASTGLVSEAMGAQFTVAADALGGVEGAFTAVQGASQLVGSALTKTGLAAKLAAVGTKIMTVAQAALNVVMRANPIGILITVLVALGVAITVAWKKSETFRNIVMGAWEAIKGAFQAAWNIIQPILNAYITVFKTVGSALAGLGRIFASVWGAVTGAVSAAWDGIRNAVKNGIKNVVDAITGLPGTIAGLAGKMVDAGKALIGGFFNGLKTLGSGALDFVAAIAQSVKDFINTNIIDKFNNLDFTLPGILGGGTIGLPDIPHLAHGATNFAGGLAVVGDRGRELVNLPPGSDVIPNNRLPAFRQPQARPDVTINQNYFGPTVSGDRRRETEWNLRYAV